MYFFTSEDLFKWTINIRDSDVSIIDGQPFNKNSNRFSYENFVFRYFEWKSSAISIFFERLSIPGHNWSKNNETDI